MANALYDKGRESFLKGEIDWINDNIRVVIVDAAFYTVNIAAHQFLSDISPSARIATSGNMSGKTATGGVADANDVVFHTVVGDPAEAVVIYQATGSEGSSRLIAYIDSAVGLPVTPNSADITITWDNGQYKIFKL